MQQGFVLLELIAVALLTTLPAVWGANTLVNAMNDAKAQDAAVWMLSIRNSAQAYLERYAGVLAQAEHAQVLPGPGYAHWDSASQLGRASCRDSVWTSVSISVCDVALKQKQRDSISGHEV